MNIALFHCNLTGTSACHNCNTVFQALDKVGGHRLDSEGPCLAATTNAAAQTHLTLLLRST